MEPMILAYATNRGLLTITEADARMLTHVNLAFGVIREGLLDISGLPDIGRVRDVRRWNDGIRFVLSIGGWGAGGFSAMAMTREGREAFADSVEAAVRLHGLDGVDIDWEYPCSGAAGIDHSPLDKENFTLLLAALRERAGGGIVSIAAGAGSYFVHGTEMERVGALCDYVQLMTYDMCGGPGRETGHHTSLYPAAGDAGRPCVDAAVRTFTQAGVPPEKLVIGAAFYSRRWGGVHAARNGLLQTAETEALFGPGYGELARDYIGKNGWVRYWDDDAKAPFLFNGSGLISYDDPESIRHKCEYLRREGLRGIMYWEHSHDDTRALLGAMHRTLRG